MDAFHIAQRGKERIHIQTPVGGSIKTNLVPTGSSDGRIRKILIFTFATMSEATASLDWRVGLEEVLLGDSPPPDWILKLCDSIAFDNGY